MKRLRWLCGLVLLTGAIVVSSLAGQTRPAPERLPPPQPGFTPKFEALAETSLLMQGLAQPNYRALAKHLEGKGPQDDDTWGFARGQALLIAETGNLLLLRPPRNAGRETWMRRAMDMRQTAGDLARRLGGHELVRSRAALQELTNKCNSCHQTFRVPTRIGPNKEPAAPDAKDGVRDTE
jgi:hypothetical protein